jgi:hypothetical protein
MSTTTDGFTKTDAAANDWAIDDKVVRLRMWGTDTTYVLPQPPIDECTVGAAESCTIRLHDPSGRVSRVHAQLLRDQGRWLLRDVGSKNGVRVDGARRSEIILQPGLEIGIGGVILLAESALLITLHGFLARLLGWGGDRIEVVDQALRSVRMAATRRSPLLLCGDSDLVSTARSIHRQSRGFDRPFIVCDPRRQTGKANVRVAENHATGMEALVAAAGGTLCVRRERLPADFERVMQALRAPTSPVQLMECAEKLDDAEEYRQMTIVIPPLASRQAELDRIIKAYARDAIAEISAPRRTFQEVDHAWVREHACTSLADVEKATLRLVALRASRNTSDAAARLGMAQISLSRWIGRRRLPMEIVQ